MTLGEKNIEIQFDDSPFLRITVADSINVFPDAIVVEVTVGGVQERYCIHPDKVQYFKVW